MTEEKYYIVEARLPLQINDVSSPSEAARKAARIIEAQYGLVLTNWEMRVFEYGEGEGNGPIAEYFSNPSGVRFRNRFENLEKHQEYFEKGIDPNEK